MKHSPYPKLSRRHFIIGLGTVGAVTVIGEGLAKQVVREIHELKPGEFTWHPDRSPSGPVAIVVSIPEQLVHVYRNGVRIAASTCSTGKPGHETPTGVFTVLQKDKHHHSSTYNNASMPNMNRLTWSGIALHAGKLPGYPASHGCVRLPLDFSEKLFEVTHVGTPVILAGSRADPYELVHPGMVLGEYAEHEFEGAVAGLENKKHPKDWSDNEVHPVTTVIASTSEKKIELLENGEVVGTGKLFLKGQGNPGEHVFYLQGVHSGKSGLAWHGISHHPDPSHPSVSEELVINRLTADHQFVGLMQRHMHPGMVMIVTSLPTSPNTRSGKDFVVMTTG